MLLRFRCFLCSVGLLQEADAAMLLESMTSQLEEEKSKFETLKEHAGAKLNAAAQQYLTVQKSDSEKDAQISSLQKQNMQLKSECNAAQAKASEAAATQRRYFWRCCLLPKGSWRLWC